MTRNCKCTTLVLQRCAMKVILYGRIYVIIVWKTMIVLIVLMQFAFNRIKTCGLGKDYP